MKQRIIHTANQTPIGHVMQINLRRKPTTIIN